MILRHEQKYSLDRFHKEILSVRLKGVMKHDIHTDSNNKYIVRSLYLDDIHDSCLNENLSSNDNRCKYRIRYYNSDLKYITLEKKVKKSGLGYKESCNLSIDEVKEIIKGNIPLIKESDSDIKKKLLTEIRIKGLLPIVIVTYSREPYTYPAGNVRITFDEDLSSSNEIDKFLTGNYSLRPVNSIEKTILEVKWDEVLPEFIKKTMSLESYVWISNSKYYLCRLMSLKGE